MDLWTFPDFGVEIGVQCLLHLIWSWIQAALRREFSIMYVKFQPSVVGLFMVTTDKTVSSHTKDLVS